MASLPNILLITADQLRPFELGCYGNPVIRTPNLDRLRQRGTRFNRAFVAAPVCGPSRACLASGLEYDHAQTPSNNHDFPTKLPTFYGKLRSAGYHVMGCGKFDLAKDSHWFGIDGKWRLHVWGFSDGINNAGKDDQMKSYHFNNNRPGDPYMTFLQSRGLMQEHIKDYKSRKGKSYSNTFPTPLPDDAYCDNWVTENGLKLLESAPDKPWFLQVNWPGPHNPEDITRSMEKSVRALQMPPVNGRDQFSATVNRAIRQNYTAMCENIDRGVGRFLDWIEAKGQMENTIVIFSSDHGEMLGDHGRWGKHVPYQPSVGVPHLAAGPGIQKGAQSSALVSSIDITATILDYGGAPTDDIDGKTLRPVLEGRTQAHRGVVYSGLGAWRLAFDGRYKVITGYDPAIPGNESDDISKYTPNVLARPPIVFDLVNDPEEANDISGSMPSAARGLLKKLQAGTYPA